MELYNILLKSLLLGMACLFGILMGNNDSDIVLKLEQAFLSLIFYITYALIELNEDQ